METKTPTYDLFVEKLKRFRKKQKTIRLVRGLERFAIINLYFLSFIILLQALVNLSSPLRVVVDVFFVIVFLASFVVFVVPAIFSLLFRPNVPSLTEVSLKVGSLYHHIHDRLANALQLFRKHESNPENYSIELVDAALHDMAGELKDENFSSKIYYRDFLIKRGNVFFYSIFLSVILVLFFYANIQDAALRLSHPFNDFSIGPNFEITVCPGDTTLLRGESIAIQARVNDPSVEQLMLTIQKFSQQEEIALEKKQDDFFLYPMKEVKDTLQYFLKYKNFRTKIFHINVIDLPLLRMLQVKVIPPAYSGLGAYLLDANVGDINALKGSVVQIRGMANKPLQSGKIIFSSGRKIGVQVNGARLTARFRLAQSDVYHFLLKDSLNFLNQNPIDYHISVIKDQYPVVRIRAPGKDIDLGDDMRIPLDIEAQDDFGILDMRLAYQVLMQGTGAFDSTAISYLTINEFRKNLDHIRVPFDWDLSGLDLLPKDVVIYYAEVRDNDLVSGPKTAKSKVYRARFPSIYDLYKQVAQDQDSSVDKLEQVYEKSLEIKKKIDELSLEMKRETELDWQKQQEVEETLTRQKELEKQLDELSQKLDEMIEKMEKNSLVSAETMEKYQELQKLIKEITTPELQKTMEKIARAMQDLDPQLLQKAMQQFKVTEEEFKQSIERTISLLKRIKLEQQLDQALKTVQDLQKRQQKIDEGIKKRENLDSLLQQQEQVKNDTKSLSDVLENLKKEMSQMPSAPEENIDKALHQLSEDGLMKMMQEMKQMMESGNQSGARQKSSGIQRSLKDIAQQLQQAKDVMSGAEQRRMMRTLKQSMRELLALSKKQEQLMNETKEMPSNSAYSSELAEQQQDLSSELSRLMDKMFEAAKESFMVDQKVGKSLGRASKNMQSALNAMQNRKNSRAAQSQAQAMAGLNSAVKNIQGSLQSMMQGNGSGGMSFEQFMQQLQRMASMQQGINEQTMGLGVGKQLSLAQQAAMARLAAQQNQIRKTMEQLAQEAGQLGEILGSLDKIVDDMEKVEKDFSNRQVTRQTIQRQQRILSRMLDAQRSIREREYSKKRQAVTAKEFQPVDPGKLPSDLGERSRLLQDLLRAKKEGYTRDYLELIKEYFDTISRLQGDETPQ